MDKPIPEALVTDALIADLLPAALIFAENEEHLAHARQRAKTILLENLTAAQQQGQAVAWLCWHPKVNDGRAMAMEREPAAEAKAVGWQCRPLTYADTAPPPSVPVGWKLVPVEPTDEMIEAGNAAAHAGGCDLWQLKREVMNAWPAMLAAAPVLAQQPAAVDELPDCPHSALDGCDCYATQNQEPPMTAETDLLPCRCGNTNLHVAHFLGACRVVCRRCEQQTSYSRNHVDMWNREMKQETTNG